jgi:hypothetical protein
MSDKCGFPDLKEALAQLRQPLHSECKKQEVLLFSRLETLIFSSIKFENSKIVTEIFKSSNS